MSHRKSEPGRKKCAHYSELCKSELEKSFSMSSYIRGKPLADLALKLNLNPMGILKWFYRKRKKETHATTRKRNGHFLSPFARRKLLQSFKQNPFIMGDRKIKLARMLNLTTNQVSSWFCSERVRKKKKSYMNRVAPEM